MNISTKQLFSISQTAKLAGTTSGTLRFYDQMGLVVPVKTDSANGYRYYAREQIVNIQTIQALQMMDMSLKEIKELLDCDDLELIVRHLKMAEQRANKKILALQQGKAKIKRAYEDYESKITSHYPQGQLFTQHIERRTILLSMSLSEPNLETLTNYHHHFYQQLGKGIGSDFEFEDQAGVYHQGENSRLFAVCCRYSLTEDLIHLPAGTYLCANCKQEDVAKVIEQLRESARCEWGVMPAFFLQMVVVTGILQWNYQIQMPVQTDSMTDVPFL